MCLPQSRGNIGFLPVVAVRTPAREDGSTGRDRGLLGPFASCGFGDFPRCPIPGDSGLADAEVFGSLRDAGAVLGTPCVHFSSIQLRRTAGVLLRVLTPAVVRR